MVGWEPLALHTSILSTHIRPSSPSFCTVSEIGMEEEKKKKKWIDGRAFNVQQKYCVFPMFHVAKVNSFSIHSHFILLTVLVADVVVISISVSHESLVWHTQRRQRLYFNYSLKYCFMLRKMVDLLVSAWARARACVCVRTRSIIARQSIQIDSLTLSTCAHIAFGAQTRSRRWKKKSNHFRWIKAWAGRARALGRLPHSSTVDWLRPKYRCQIHRSHNYILLANMSALFAKS